MKIAPLLKAIAKHNIEHGTANIKPVLIHTGQHYDYEMSQIFFQELELPKPDLYLGIGSGTHAEQTGRIMIELEKALFLEKPDLVIVVGDVNSTLAAALAAVKLRIPVAHVEAGLRSKDKSMPEEINRLLTDVISDYLFVTSPYAVENLKREGIPEAKIFLVGNIMIDTLLYSRKKAEQSQILSQLGLKKEGYALLTLHRPVNVDQKESLANILAAIVTISQRIPVVFPAHPRTQKKLEEFDLISHLPGKDRQLIYIEPLGYLDFLKLMMNARFVMTDSGGIEAETTILDIPCLTTLDTTGWEETVSQGTNIIVGNHGQRLVAEAIKLLEGKNTPSHHPELWDGKTAERIVNIFAKYFEGNENRHVFPSS